METLRQQYADGVHEAFLECESSDTGKVDLERLSEMLERLRRNARIEGLPGRDFDEIVRSMLPEYWKQLERLSDAA